MSGEPLRERIAWLAEEIQLHSEDGKLLHSLVSEYMKEMDQNENINEAKQEDAVDRSNQSNLIF